MVRRDSVEYLDILSQVFTGLTRRMPDQRTLESEGITPALSQCLEFVYLHGPSTIGKIADGLSISLPAASQLVDRLVKKGLVTRETSIEDRRRARAWLTDRGRLVIMRVRSTRSLWLRHVLDRMPEDRRKMLIDNLEEFIRLAIEVNGSAGDACVHCGIGHLAFCIVNKTHISAAGEPLEEF
jgi:DNA-binding MarR family transcriptional regulator